MSTAETWNQRSGLPKSYLNTPLHSIIIFKIIESYLHELTYDMSQRKINKRLS